jgi:osmotically-inducible protein OsmY
MNPRLLLISLACLPLLQGCVGLFVAGAATTASVANDRRSVGSVIDDQNIELKATDAIASRSDLDKASNISATCINGKVLLVGQTPYTQYSRDAESLVGRIAGVRQVYNELLIRKTVSLSTQSNDTWITSKIKSEMLGTKDFDSTRFKVVTENSEVFLMGLVTRAEADKAVDIARRVSGVHKVVKVFEYIQGNGQPATSGTSATPSGSSSYSSGSSSSGGTEEVQMGSAPEEVIK